MTVSNTTVARKDYTGDGSVKVFAYDFRILDPTHLEVLVDGVVQVHITAYSVSGSGVSTGETSHLEPRLQRAQKSPLSVMFLSHRRPTT